MAQVTYLLQFSLISLFYISLTFVFYLTLSSPIFFYLLLSSFDVMCNFSFLWYDTIALIYCFVIFAFERLLKEIKKT